MALSKKAHEALRRAITEDKALTEVEAQLTKQAANVAAIATADATDLATAITLANATKAKVNSILSALQAAGLMA